jgi:fucose permease
MTGALAAGLSWRWGYGAVALGQAGLAVAFLATTRAWRDGRVRREVRPARVRRDGSPSGPAPAASDPVTPAAPEPVTPAAPEPVTPAVARTLALPAVWRGAASFAVYAGVELGAGLWAYLLLTGARGMGEAAAGVAVSGYWGSLFAGRLLVGAVADRAGVHRVLAGGVVGLVAGAALVAVPAPGWLAVAGLVLVGLAAAPVFPLLTLTTAGRVGDRHADRAIGVQIGAAALGGTALPAGIGVLVGRFSPEVLGPCLLLLALALAALYLPTRRRPSAS